MILGWADDDPQGQARRAGQRRHRRGRHQRPPARRRGHRPVPHRAHVPRRRPPAGRAPDDPRRHRRRRRPTRSRSCARSSRPTSRRSSRRWTACRSRCACSTRRCTSSCRRSRSCAIKEATERPRRRGEASCSRAAEAWARAQPDARHPRRAPRRGQARASTRCRCGRCWRRPPSCAAQGRQPDRRDHDPAHRHPRGAGTSPAAGSRTRSTRPTKGLKKKPDVTIGTMIETPRAALRADEIAEEADFFSFGTNDLTQMTFGFSRDDVESRMMPAYLEQGLLKRNPFETIDHDGVGELVRIGAERGRQTKPEAQARRVRRARRRPRVDRPLLRRRPRLRQLLAVPGADRPAGRRPGHRRRRQQRHPLEPKDAPCSPPMTSPRCSPPTSGDEQLRRPRRRAVAVGGASRPHRRRCCSSTCCGPPRGRTCVSTKEAAIECGGLDLDRPRRSRFVVLAVARRPGRRRVLLRLPDREEPQHRQRVRLGADPQRTSRCRAKYQHRVLFWGIFGALVLRADRSSSPASP